MQMPMPWEVEETPFHEFQQDPLPPGPPTERYDTEEGRIYVTPDGPMWSVTTLLGVTADKEYLVEWRERIGDEEADRIVERACERGERMHDALEQRLLNNTDWIDSCLRDKEAEIMARTIETRLVKLDPVVHATERFVWCPIHKYAGSLDGGISLRRGGRLVGATLDFKNSRRYRTVEGILDYRHQVTLYGAAADQRFGVRWDVGLILMAMAEDYLGDDSRAYWVDVVDHRDEALERVRVANEKLGDPAEKLEAHLGG